MISSSQNCSDFYHESLAHILVRWDVRMPYIKALLPSLREILMIYGRIKIFDVISSAVLDYLSREKC